MNSQEINETIENLKQAKEYVSLVTEKMQRELNIYIKQLAEHKASIPDIDKQIADLEYDLHKELARESNIMSQVTKEIMGVPNPVAPKENETFDEWYGRIVPKETNDSVAGDDSISSPITER